MKWRVHMYPSEPRRGPHAFAEIEAPDREVAYAVAFELQRTEYPDLSIFQVKPIDAVTDADS